MASRYQSYLRTIKRRTGATHREAQLAWQRLRPWLEQHDAVSSAAIARHPVKLREYVALAQGYVPSGWWTEVSLQTRGGTYRRGGRRGRDKRPLMVKVRVQARAALPIAEHERAVRLAIRAGAVPEGFVVAYADWEKGTGRKMRSGHIPQRALSDLTAFYGALRHPHTDIRVDMVSEEEQ